MASPVSQCVWASLVMYPLAAGAAAAGAATATSIYVSIHLSNPVEGRKAGKNELAIQLPERSPLLSHSHAHRYIDTLEQENEKDPYVCPVAVSLSCLSVCTYVRTYV